MKPEPKYVLSRMDYYTDRSTRSNYLEIADQCVNGILVLWDANVLDVKELEGNIFQYQFDGNDIILKTEYLFAMDYLTYVLTAYQKTGNEIYRNTFEKIITQFHDYLQKNEQFDLVYTELPIYAQTVLLVKAITLLGSLPYQDDFVKLLIRYAHWLMDDNNYVYDHNHGVFLDLALLHISVLLSQNPEAELWKEHAVKRICDLFKVAYYHDGTNNENSLQYFHYNNYLYGQVTQFCRHYHISGVEQIEMGLEKVKKTLTFFAHQDGSFPVIGDGHIFFGERGNQESRLFPDIGMAVVKVGKLYLSFKGKTVFLSHAHTDVSSITARYQNLDFLIDSGQYNYDRYTPANRFMRSAAGHAGIFPMFADGMFQKEFCEAMVHAGISAYECGDTEAYIRGEYQLRDVRVCREITVKPTELIVKDSWHCETSTAMRQRFILPQGLIAGSRFHASKRLLEIHIDHVIFQFEIESDIENAFTNVHFGIAAPQYNAYETTLILDTFVENTLSGEITARISIMEDER